MTASRLAEARLRTLELLAPLDDADLERQWSELQSPLVWDLAHIGHFEELWIARRLGGLPPLLAEGDDLYDAFGHVRGERGELPILRADDARGYLEAVRERTLDVLGAAEWDAGDPLARDGYAVALVLQHELQHQETMLQTIQLAGLVHPGGGPRRVEGRGERVLEAGTYAIGTDDEAWAYDNERPEHAVTLAAVAVDAVPVTNREFESFVAETGAQPPLYWEGGGVRRFGRVVPRDPDEPVQHVGFHEAEAYAGWAGRRLPSELEWEAAAAGGLLRGTGEVWEWTASPFRGYPGFRAFPYAEYSEVFFGDDYRVLRGGSWATSPLVARTTFRNWDFPIRRQIFAGLRCARDL